MSQNTYKKRAFLDLPENENGYICAVVESSEKGSYSNGNYILPLADCKQNVELEFPLSSLNLIRRSLAKADLIADMVDGFRKALKVQAELIRNYKGEQFKKKNGKGHPEVVKPKTKGPTEEEVMRTKLRRRRGGGR